MEKRYNSFVEFFKNKYGHRLQKIVIDAGFTCPNRDGSISRGGCTFCDNAAFHPGYSVASKSIATQIEEGIEFHRGRYRNTLEYLAYFQPYSNTYAPLGKLKSLYEEALSHKAVAGIVIGTRPDCIDGEKLDYLAQLSKDHIVIVEYGIESCNNATLAHINRGHTWEQAEQAVRMTAERGIMQGAHFIIGLPGETREDFISMAEKINTLPIDSVKFHQLQIIKGTAMENEFSEHPERFVTFSLDEYIDLFVDILERLRPTLYIERFAGEVPPRFVNSTPWGLIRNVELLRLLDKRLEERNTYQGRLV
ncbi:MAG: TIGR01212 family radical SAM protein [Bacteroidales bacterium]|nr:TIGR01212 family radical SAM protein [Bacteroidales bacterium]